MVSTVLEVADRCYRNWLHAPDDQPVIVSFAADFAVGDVTLTYDHSALAPDEEELIAPGVLIEAGTELMRIVNAASESEIVVRRGMNGTQAQAHSDGDEIRVAPTFARSTIVDAVKDAVVALYPTLWRNEAVALTTARGIVEVPGDVVTAASFLLDDGTPRSVRVFSTPESTTGRAAIFPGTASGKTGYLLYKGRFPRPFSDTTDLYNLGVLPEWERIVEVGAVAQAVAGRDLDALTAEYITEQLSTDALPVEAPQRIRNGLLTLYNIWIAEARRSLRGDEPIPVEMNQ